MKEKIKAHVFTLPRWFAAPFFGSAVLLGAVLAGGINSNAWMAFIAAMLVMAGGHAFNSFLDYAWTGLDKGEVGERSAEKDYTEGQNLIESGIVSARETAINGIACYALSAIPIIFLISRVGWQIAVPWVIGMLITFWYAKAKFNWTQELAIGSAAGPVAVLLGMFAITPNPDWVTGLIVSVPLAVTLGFGDMPLDEWPDAEANLKKGVKSIAYMVWKNKLDLGTYMMWWMPMVYCYQVFLIVMGYLAPLTAITFVIFPFLVGATVLLKPSADAYYPDGDKLLRRHFKKWATAFIIIIAFYPVLLLVGQIIGG